MNSYSNIDDYIVQFPPEVRARLEWMRAIIHEEVPHAEEAISYGIPRFRVRKKNLVHFAGYKAHIGFYPGSAGIAAFQEEIKHFKHAKGSVQFPLSEPLPEDIIRNIVRFCLNKMR